MSGNESRPLPPLGPRVIVRSGSLGGGLGGLVLSPSANALVVKYYLRIFMYVVLLEAKISAQYPIRSLGQERGNGCRDSGRAVGTRGWKAAGPIACQ